MAAGGLHISISAEKLFSIGSLSVTNSMLTSLVASGLLIAFAVWVRSSLKETNRPTGVQNVAEWIVESLLGLVQSVTNDYKKTTEFFPLVAAFFFFIMLNNLLGLIPGVGTFGFYKTPETEHAQVREEAPVTEGESATQAAPVKEETAPAAEEKEFIPFFRAGTADLNTTLALGLFSIVTVQLVGIRHQGLKYFKKFINVSNPINFFVGFLEIVSEFSRIISFAFRLFGNVFAGEVLLAVIGSLVPLIVPMPFYGMEIFVGFIQALVFAMLTVVFFNMATMGHDDH